jgi:hypothetical protein
MRRGLQFLLPALSLYCWTVPASADYTLVLTNGRRITVQSYREEGRMIKFQGLGGEIGISKDQIQSIQKVGMPESGGLTLSAPGPASSSEAPRSASQEAAPPQAAERPVSPEEQRAREEREYRQKLIDITQQLKEAEDRYSQSIRGTTSQDPNLQWSAEQRAATRDDALSRFREATSNPSEPAPVKLLTPSPFSTLPPTITEDRPVGRAPTTYENLPPVTDQQRELTEFRNQMIQLERERDRLINEMKEKNLGLGTALRE